MAVLRFVACYLLLAASAAKASIEVPTFDPPKPTSLQSVTMSIAAGPCTFLTDGPDEVDVLVDGTDIEVVIDGVYSPFQGGCPGSVQLHTFTLGSFAPGSYLVHVTVRDAVPPPFTLYRSLQVTPLIVSSPASSPARIPALSGPGGCILLASVMAAACLAARNRRLLLVIVTLACWRGDDAIAIEPAVHAVAVLLESGPGRPAPSDVADNYDFSSGGSPPIAGLAAGNPTRATYLIPRRPTGDYAQWLEQHPQSVRAILQRYLVVFYDTAADAADGLAAFYVDPDVADAYPLVDYGFTSETSEPKGGAVPYWRPAIGDVSPAHPRGWASIGVVDAGAATSHPALREFSDSGAFLGGGLRVALSRDLGRTGVGLADDNVDELEPEAVFPADVACDADANGLISTDFAGHGTHVAGLVVAKDNAGVAGTCIGCSLGMVRVTLLRCDKALKVVRPVPNAAAFVPALDHLANVGAQVISQSYGRGDYLENDYCASHSNNPMCLQITALVESDIVLVAASGNDRNRIDFPARDPRQIAVGGLDDSLGFWDEDTQGEDLANGCPYAGSSKECGSNFTTHAGERAQDFVAPARKVLSTTYPSENWNLTIGCGDGTGTPNGDGYGLCTGTSMAAPIVAGIAAAVRSVNPLLDASDVRTILRLSALRPDGGLGWDSRLGYGVPQRDVATQRSLGKVGKKWLTNRATPLFGMHSPGALDRASVATPQSAVSLMVGPAAAWTPEGASIAGYPTFPGEAGKAPRADAFVFTTEASIAHGAVMVALHGMRRSRPWPLGCTPGQSGCNGEHIDHVLLTDTSEVPAFATVGYDYLGVNGYVIKRCVPEPSCIPPGAVELLRRCNMGIDDCAAFTRAREAEFAALGYTATLSASDTLGYVLPNVDTDGDALIDGLESMIGLNPKDPDSDNDGVTDGTELPLSGIPASDPCPRGTCDASFIFADGLE